ncbi:MAG: ATP-binding protein [Planctomycetota bacterium]|nr:MAG: ATP-binding protein [Planctomycetota bacterium]
MDKSYEMYKKFRGDAQAAEVENRLKDAARFNLEAARYLLKAAKASSGRIRETRKRQAGVLVKFADRLEAKAAKSKAAKNTAAGRPDTPVGHLEEPGKSAGSTGSPEAVAEVDLSSATFFPEPKTGITFDDVAGLEEVKREIDRRVVKVREHQKDAAELGLRIGGGMLMYGPPGTGKTMFAKAMAETLDAAFFHVKASEIMSKWVGDAEKNVSKLFEDASKYRLSIIFIDEIEAMLKKRSKLRSTVAERVVNEFLASLDGFSTEEGKRLIFVGATNRPWEIDEAVLRPGRFDNKFHIGLPDLEARRRILELNLEGRAIEDDVDLDALAVQLEGYSGADIRNICDHAAGVTFDIRMKEKSKKKISHKYLLDAIEHIKPSVTGEIVKKFAEWEEIH